MYNESKDSFAHLPVTAIKGGMPFARLFCQQFHDFKKNEKLLKKVLTGARFYSIVSIS